MFKRVTVCVNRLSGCLATESRFFENSLSALQRVQSACKAAWHVRIHCTDAEHWRRRRWQTNLSTSDRCIGHWTGFNH